jgi:hypothetical protein
MYPCFEINAGRYCFKLQKPLRIVTFKGYFLVRCQNVAKTTKRKMLITLFVND